MDSEEYNLMISAVSFCYMDFYIIITHKVLTDNTITRVTLFAVITKKKWKKNPTRFVEMLIY